ncbi:hypothetical protein A5722_04735 [Mycobacterium vulneris]|nr:hypothetical protein A5722_04735 [Mycolicibacterium vulneris]OCB64369.1 hypothetical protein A5729_21885 [Mycolicibacterium vulneris]
MAITIKIGRRSYRPSEIRKLGVAAAAAVGSLATSALDTFAPWFPAGWAAPIASGIAFVGAIGVFLVKNAPLIDATDALGE